MSRKIVTELTTPRERLGKRKGYLQEVLIRSATEVTTSESFYLSAHKETSGSLEPIVVYDNDTVTTIDPWWAFICVQ